MGDTRQVCNKSCSQRKGLLRSAMGGLLVATLTFLGLLVQNPIRITAQTDKIYPGADEKMPSRAYYFDWINSQYEGSTETANPDQIGLFQVAA